MSFAKVRVEKRKKRADSVRKTIEGTPDRPRLCVRRSLKHISAQLIDDTTGKSIAQVTSASKEVTDVGNKTDLSVKVGELIALKAAEKGISNVVFDRKGYQFHGRVKALAEAARGKGLKF